MGLLAYPVHVWYDVSPISFWNFINNLLEKFSVLYIKYRATNSCTLSVLCSTFYFYVYTFFLGERHVFFSFQCEIGLHAWDCSHVSKSLVTRRGVTFLLYVNQFSLSLSCVITSFTVFLSYVSMPCHIFMLNGKKLCHHLHVYEESY